MCDGPVPNNGFGWAHDLKSQSQAVKHVKPSTFGMAVVKDGDLA